MSEKHSGQVWSQKKQIAIDDPKGWKSIDDFNHRLIAWNEFLLRASNSKPRILNINGTSRRIAGKALRFLLKA